MKNQEDKKVKTAATGKSSVPEKRTPKHNAIIDPRDPREEMWLAPKNHSMLPDINVIGGKQDGEVIRVKTGVDRILFVLTLVLVSFGSIMVFSASYADAQARYGDSYYFIRRQILFVAIGLGLMLFVMTWPDTWFHFFAIPSYFVTIGLLLVVLAMGLVGGGAQRWIGIGSVTFQPSELAKLTIVLTLSWYYTTFQDQMRYKPYKMLSKNPERRKAEKKMWWRSNFLYGIFFPGCILMVYVVLIALEKHLSGIIIIGLIGLIVMFAAGCNAAILGTLMGVAGVAVAAFAVFVDYTKRRIDIWLNPKAYPLDGGWQTLQGMNAIGSGGLFGLGLGGSRQKYSYVSEPQNDFIFTIVCEELGFIGACGVILLLALFVWRGYVIAMRAPNAFSGLVAFGITSKVAIQALLNIAVVTNSIPNTGISFPFFSYGGSSLVLQFIEVGVLLAISKYSYQRR